MNHRADNPPMLWATMSTRFHPRLAMKAPMAVAFVTLFSDARSMATAVRPFALNRAIMSAQVAGLPR